MGEDIATIVLNGGTTSEFPNFSKLPHGLNTRIWNFLWEPRDVEVKRYIEAHKSDMGCSGSKAKAQSNGCHRDQIFQSHAFMITEWDGSPHAQAIGQDLTVAQRMATEEDKPSHKASELAERTGRFQQDDLQRVHTITTTTAEPPSTLFVNKESRLVTLRLYTLVFGLPGGDSRVYLSFAPGNFVLSRHAQLE